MAIVLIGHVVWVVSGRQPLREWIRRWASALILGLAAYIGVVGTMAHANRGRVFSVSFPVRLLIDVLGGFADRCRLAFHDSGSCVSSSFFEQGLLCRGVRSSSWSSGSSYRAVTLLPLFRLGRARCRVRSCFAVSRLRSQVLATAMAIKRRSASFGPYTIDPLPSRSAARFLDASLRRGAGVCALVFSGDPLLAYTHDFRNVSKAEELRECDVAVATRALPTRRSPAPPSRRCFGGHCRQPPSKAPSTVATLFSARRMIPLSEHMFRVLRPVFSPVADKLVIPGAREHNLRNLNSSSPRNGSDRLHRACPGRASRRWPSTRSTPRASAATSSRSRPTPGSSSARWTSPTSTSSRACRRPSRSTRSRPAATRGPPSAPSPRSTTTCACSTPASACRTAPK